MEPQKNPNELLAESINKQLVKENLISASNTQLVSKLSNGSLKDGDWKIALEEVLNIKNSKTNQSNETK
jgi:hypothetical protein